MKNRLSRTFLPWLAHHFGEFIYWYLGAFISLFVLHRLQLELPLKIKSLVNEGTAIDHRLIFTFSFIAIGIFVFRTCSRLLFFYPARVQQKFLRSELVAALERTSPKRYEKFGQGQIYQILFNDINRLRAFVGFALLQIGNVFVAMIVLLPSLYDLPAGMLLALSPMFISLFLFTLVSIKQQSLTQQSSKAQGQVQQFIMESYDAKSTIQNYHVESSFARAFEVLVKKELDFFWRISLGYAWSIPLIRLGLGISLLWGALILRLGGSTVGDLIFFSGFLFLLLEPLMFFAWMGVVTSDGLAAWKRVKELWHSTTDESIRGDTSDKLENVEIIFWNKTVTLPFRQMEWMVIAGETGSGKSECLKQLAEKFLEKNIKISLVQQDPFLFNDSIEENVFLTLDRTSIKINLCFELFSLMGLSHLGTSPQDILKLVIGENGKRISGGERKRLALIRSLLSDADVFLWDDPFSSVDIIQERKILNELQNKFKNKTFILSSHRWTTIRDLSTLVFIANQSVSFVGAPKEALIETKIKDFFHEQLV